MKPVLRFAAGALVAGGVALFGEALRRLMPVAGQPGLWLFSQAVMLAPRVAGAAVLWLLLPRAKAPPNPLPRTAWAAGVAALALGWAVYDASSPVRLPWTTPERWLGYWVVAAAALFEELAFRGVLLGSLCELISPWTASLVSSALFTAFYVNVKSPEQFPMIFLSGQLLAQLRLGGAPLGLLILVHAVAEGLWFQLGRGSPLPKEPLGLTGLGLLAAANFLCKLEAERLSS